VLATTLFVIMIAMMLTTTLVAMNRQSLLFTAGANDRLAALEMAQSGLNRIIDRWSTDPGFASALSYKDEEHRRGYDIVFSGSDASLNNMLGAGELQGVPARCARVVVTGYSGSVTKRIRCLVGRSLFPVSKPVNAAEHSIAIFGDFTLNGIKNPRDPVESGRVKAGLHTNYAGRTSQLAMATQSSATELHVDETSFLSAVTPQNPNKDFDSNVRDQLESQPDALKPDSNKLVLARNDVPKALERAKTTAVPLLPPPDLLTPVIITQDTIVGNGSEVALGPIQVLDDATLFVNGSLVTPVVRGKGSLVVGGDVRIFKGARMILGNAGVSMVAGGDISMRGGALDTSILDTPTLQQLSNNLLQELDKGLEGAPNASEIAGEMAEEVRTQQPNNEELIEALDDMHNSLSLFGQASMPAYQQPKAIQLIRSHNQTFAQSFSSFVTANRLTSMSSVEFGRGHFQGLAFAGRNLKVGGRFRVIGGVEAGENMELGQDGNDRVELTYCEAYRNLCPAGLGSPCLVTYQEE